MPLIFGQTSSGLMVALLVDANGVLQTALPAGVEITFGESLPAGSNLIGSVDVDSLPSLPAGDNNIGNVDIVTLPELAAGTQEIGKVQSRLYGYYSGAWQKGPIPFGYSGDKSESVDVASASAGTNILSGSLVPAGEIWVLQAVHAADITNVPSRLYLSVVVNGVVVVLTDVTTLTAGINTTWNGSIVLSEGDRVRSSIFGCTAADVLQMRYHAVRVDIDQ
jgi:hypothetical protein